MAKKRLPKCLRCKRVQFARGLCRSCYEAARHLMRSGQKTEAQLLEKGLILPAKRMGRPKSTTGENEERLAQLEKEVETLKAGRNVLHTDGYHGCQPMPEHPA